jgi:beta-xylosidase
MTEEDKNWTSNDIGALYLQIANTKQRVKDAARSLAKLQALVNERRFKSQGDKVSKITPGAAEMGEIKRLHAKIEQLENGLASMFGNAWSHLQNKFKK